MEQLLENKTESVNALESSKFPSIRVIWNDKIENYSQERIREIKSYISKKYNTEKVQVNFKPTNTIKYVNVSEDSVESLSSPEVQTKLFKEWMEENQIEIKFDDLERLDKKVIANLIDNQEVKFTKWGIKKLTIDNFLSYGNETIVDFSNLKGFNLIHGTNQVGKTTWIIDALLFLFFNKTTRTKVSDEVLNIYNDKDYAKVEGEIDIDGITYIISRQVNRKWKKDKSSYTTSTELKFFKIQPDGSIEDLNGEQRQETDKIISESIGTMDDFLMTIVSTGDNLFDILEAKPTERGQVVMKFLGLEIFEKKEAIAKEFYSDWKKKSKLNLYNQTDLLNEIDNLKKEIELKIDDRKALELKLEELKKEITSNTKNKDNLLLGLNKEIEKKYINITEQHIQNSINTFNTQIKLKQDEIKSLENLIKSDDIEFDLIKHNEIVKEERDVANEGITLKSETDNISKLIKQLESSEFCPTCKQALKDVDHSKEIDDNKKLLEESLVKINELKEKYTKVKTKLTESENLKSKVNEVERNKLKKEKAELELDSINLKLTNEQKNLDDYKNSLKVIENNKKIEEQLREVEIVLSSLKVKERDCANDIFTIDNFVKNSNEDINSRNELIKTLKSETYIDKIFTAYLMMVGKNGISKTILKHSIPTINSELNRMLSDVCDFTISVDINIKNNEVEFWMTNIEKDVRKSLNTGSGYERTIACIALRVILNKINSLPKPSMIVFDECLGKVAEDRFEDVKLLLDKVKNMFQQIFIISHENIVKEWANNVISVEKINNFSKLTIS